MSISVGSESEAPAVGKPDRPLEVQLSRPVAAPLSHVWDVLVSPRGSNALLGEGATLGAKGETYHCADGSTGVLRSYHPLEQLRISWHETPDSPPSIVEVDLRADGADTVLDLTQNHLTEVSDLVALSERWSAALAAVAQVAEA